MSSFEAFPATSEQMIAVIRLVGGWRGSAAPNRNCGIFDNEPVGVIEVIAVLLAATRASTMMSGMASAPSNQSTPNQACVIHTASAPTSGTPL